MSTSTKTGAPYYFVPDPSKWPMFGAIALLLFGLSMGLYGRWNARRRGIPLWRDFQG